MSLESIIRSTDDASEEREFTSLRPKDFSEYIGQKRIIRNLKIAVQAARERGEPLDHLLFHGPPGLGKTTLAHVIAAEMDAEIVCTSGPALERPADLVGILTNLSRGDVLFIDEIHRLPRIVEEYIYPAMEDFQIDMVIDPGPHARTVKLELNHFTIVGPPPGPGSSPAPSGTGSVSPCIWSFTTATTSAQLSGGRRAYWKPPSPKGGPNQWPCDPGARPE